MGIGFVIFVWLFFFGGFISIYALSRYFAESFFIAGVIKDSLKPIGMIFLCLLFVGLTIGGINVILDRFFPSYVFSTSFGFSPTADIRELEGQRFSFGDAGSSYLKFRAKKETVEKIINNRTFIKTDKTDYLNYPNEDLREILSNQKSEISLSSKFESGFGISSAILAYDEESEKVYFSWGGSD